MNARSMIVDAEHLTPIDGDVLARLRARALKNGGEP